MKSRRHSKKMMIALISAVPSEGSFLVRRLRLERTSQSSLPLFYHGEGEKSGLLYAVSGMGKTNAAHTATVLSREYSPRLLINFGVGGAYPSAGLALGDVMVAESEIYGDEGVRDSDGFHGAEYMGIPFLKRGRKKYYNEFALDRGLSKRALASATSAFKGADDAPKVGSGRFVTVSTCTGTRKRAAELGRRWGAICENMEGAAIAHICALYGTPLTEIRGVSNIVDDRDKAKWDLELASRNCCRAVVQLLKALTPDRS
jgi:futalosine hydrolase